MLAPRYFAYYACLALCAVFLALALLADPALAWPLAILVPLAAVGTRDLVQPRHAILRNYPLIGHLRFLFEDIRPELRQYFFESNQDGRPFSRERRSLVYQRAKNEEGNMPFGTEIDVDAEDYQWVNHSLAPKEHAPEVPRVAIGGPDCRQPYSASLYNISAMSFGSLSANAILALNKGAKLGTFAHDTGEGGISRYHREFGGDLIWEIGSGYFGCRTPDGRFDPDRFAAQASDPQVKMVEVKLSQGAKPGHGGVLPGSKVTEEIAEARGVAVGEECVSPAAHSAFATPVELLQFVARLRQLSGGKPAGFKLCIGHKWEFMAIAKAMLETGITPDFIVVDGGEGGTGAAPVEFSNRLGTPLKEGLSFVHNVLVGTNLRERIRIGASGKLISAFDLASALCLGADWCNSARGFMFAIGCIQSQSCHTNRCPTGVATQDRRRQQALVVPDKAQRVANFHRNTLKALAGFTAAAGLEHPKEFTPAHFYLREGHGDVLPASKALRWLAPGALLAGEDIPGYSNYWQMATADSFQPVRPVAPPTS
ncbi:FMN-binding glutamate synthase family protein [Polymorphum gilvum]|uniref:Glutamate synthase, large subunit, putative n=1 Tax=Polymorphum gilvum (strain LMG 25793 / CGMCC 1.9160 / SL003B-26A1) TaxID=991905 RepID=F2IV27_POLGS|nr:FMN-binding glutamate synthase family protein [Polymorphum gilvum]ADZ71358.1 Glutamate synthase, large subunit, putative [Polymorphum gilvum SL003B-26A1]